MFYQSRDEGKFSPSFFVSVLWSIMLIVARAALHVAGLDCFHGLTICIAFHAPDIYTFTLEGWGVKPDWSCVATEKM